MAHGPHAYWQYQYLHEAGLPTGNANVYFLTDWGQHANAGCNYNALDISHREPGSTRCHRLPNGRFARRYTDTHSAALAFASQISSGRYVHLLGALVAGEPYTYTDTKGVADDLGSWGSARFQAYYDTQAGRPAPSGSGGGRSPQSKNVGGAWSHLMRVLAVDGHRTTVELRKATASLNRIERRLRRA